MIELATTTYGTCNLGELIDSLERRAGDKTVRFGFCGFGPGHLTSYRGHYDHLAIIPVKYASPTVTEFLTTLREAIGKTFTGYKGGDFRMDRQTPIWVDDYSECTSTAIVALYGDDYSTVIHTRMVD